MRPTWARTDEGQEGNHPGIRRQLIGLIQKGRRSASFSKHRPTEVRPWEIIRPESSLPLLDTGMWSEIVQFLDSGVPLEKISLRQPPGEEAWVCLARLASDSPLIYMKLQIRGSRVLLRSFHIAEYDD